MKNIIKKGAWIAFHYKNNHILQGTFTGKIEKIDNETFLEIKKPCSQACEVLAPFMLVEMSSIFEVYNK